MCLICIVLLYCNAFIVANWFVSALPLTGLIHWKPEPGRSLVFVTGAGDHQLSENGARDRWHKSTGGTNQQNVNVKTGKERKKKKKKEGKEGRSVERGQRRAEQGQAAEREREKERERDWQATTSTLLHWTAGFKGRWDWKYIWDFELLWTK